MGNNAVEKVEQPHMVDVDDKLDVVVAESNGAEDADSPDDSSRTSAEDNSAQNLALLCCAYMVGFSAMTATLTTTAISTKDVLSANGDSTNWATIPIGVQFAGTSIGSFMLSTLMKQVGRHRGFLVGCLLGAGGASLAAVGLHASSFALIVVGAFFIGVGSAGTQLIRFVALEVVSEEWKPRAPPLVLVGGLLGAFLGPYMALRTSKEHTIVSGNDFAGTYWVMAGGMLLMGQLLYLVQIPAPKEKTVDERPSETLPMGALLLEGRGEAAALATVCYSVMVMVMTPTPLVMQADGFSYAQATTVIQCHLVAMFAPSFFTGELIKSLGERTVVYTGCMLLTCSFGVLQVDTGLTFYITGLILLGVGWNFGYVSATMMLANASPEEDKERLQGLNDMVLFSVSSIGTMFSSGIVGMVGWENYIWLAMAYVLLISLVAFVTSGSKPSTSPSPVSCSADIHTEMQSQEPSAGPECESVQAQQQPPAAEQREGASERC